MADYSPHHEPFQYYASTPTRTTCRRSVGDDRQTDQANHQYDLAASGRRSTRGNLPAVSFLKAAGVPGRPRGLLRPAGRAALPGRHDQRTQSSPNWSSTAIVIAYDDSDGWYDHVMPPIVSQSALGADALTGAGHCGTARAGGIEVAAATARACRCW